MNNIHGCNNPQNLTVPEFSRSLKKHLHVLMTIIVVIAAFLTLYLISGRQKRATHVSEGVVDISLLRDTIIALDGEWVCLEENTGQDHHNVFALLPAFWEQPYGFSRYSIQVVGLNPLVKYALWVPAVETSFRVLGNGKELFAAGHPDRIESRTRAAYLSGVALIPDGLSRIELVLEVANYGHRQGGPGDIPKIGVMDDVLRYDAWNVASDSTVIIVFLIIGGIYTFNALIRRNKCLVFIALILIFSSLEIFFSSPQVLVYRVFPLLDFGFYKKTQYLVSFLLVLWVVLAAWNLFGNDSFRTILFYVGPYILGLVFIALTPYTLFTRTIAFFQLYSALLLIGALVICLWGAKKGYAYSRGIVLAFILMMGIGLSEIIYMNSKSLGGQYLLFSCITSFFHLEHVPRIILDILSYGSIIVLINALSLVFIFEERKVSVKTQSSVSESTISHGINIDLVQRKCQSKKLSPRETEVVILALQGKSNMEIGEELFISLSTVKTHFSRIFQKTGTKTRGELFAFFWN